LIEEGPSSGPSNPVGRPDATPTGTKVVEETRPTRTQESVGESYLNRSFPPSSMLDTSRRHPFIDYVIGAQLPPTWKGLNINPYEETNDPGEHIDIYTTHMSLYTSDKIVLC